MHIKQKFAFFLLNSGVFKCLSLVQYWPGKSRLSGSRVVHPIIQEIILRPPRFENRHKRSGSNGGQNDRCLLNNYKYFMLNIVFTLLFLLIDSLSMKGVWLQSLRSCFLISSERKSFFCHAILCDNANDNCVTSVNITLSSSSENIFHQEHCFVFC